MPANDYNLLVISDLHLSEGFLPIEGKYGPNEDFFSDAHFARFLDYHNQHRENGRPWRLIFAGDLFDFLQVTLKPAHNPTELLEAVNRLQQQLADPTDDLAHPVHDPTERRSQIQRWLHYAEEDGRRQNAEKWPLLRRAIQRLCTLAAKVQGEHLWHVENLVMVAWLLAVKKDYSLSKNEAEYGLGTTWQETVWKLNRIADGHPEFFQGLAHFLLQGNAVTVMNGNHDIELFWPQVKERLVTVLADSAVAITADPTAPATILEQVEFAPWIYYEPGVVYIEHGSQYEVANAYDNFARPILQRDPTKIQLPPGSFFVRYVFNKLEAAYTFADNIRPKTRFVTWVLQNDLFMFLRLVVRYAPNLGRFLKELVSKALQNRAKVGQHAALQAPAAPLNLVAGGELSEEQLRQIEALGRKVRNNPVSKVLAWLPFITTVLFLLLFVAGPLFILIRGWLADGAGSPWLNSAILAGVTLLLRQLFLPALTRLASGGDYLQNAVRGLVEIVGETPYFVLGHSHDPQMARVEPESKSWYVNTGSWLYSDAEVERWSQQQRDHVFLQIVTDRRLQVPPLYRWDVALGQPVRLRLRTEAQKKRSRQRSQERHSPLSTSQESTAVRPRRG